MVYEIRWAKTSLERLGKLDKKLADRIINSIENIKGDPFMSVKKLAGINLYSLRSGDYRIIISIEKNSLFILDLGHQSKIYVKY